MEDLQSSSGSVDHGDWLHKATDAHNLKQVQSQFTGVGQIEKQRLSPWKNDSHGELPLHCTAAWLGRLDIVKLLMSEDPPHLTDEQSADSQFCLHFAAAGGHADIVQWLVESCRANVTLQNCDGNTPLHLAVSAGHTNVVPYLVPEAASLLTLNKIGMMPISYCMDHPMFEALTCASFSVAGPSIVHPALHINARKRTILHYAAQFGQNPDAILMLIHNSHSYMHHEDDQQNTFLHVAAQFGNVHILEALKKLGPTRIDVQHLFSVGAHDPLRISPGMYALLHNHWGFFNELITVGKVEITLGCIIKGLLLELADNPGINQRFGLFASTLPTYLALYANKECIYNFLLQTETASHCQWDGEYKRTCQHWAIVDERTDIVRKLCSNVQLQPGLQDTDGKTVVHHAFDKKSHMVMEILMSKRSFKEHEEKLYRDRDVYVQALNAILVVVALIVSVTFAGWLQLPSGAKFHSVFMKMFWASNSTSFFTALATMCVAITALLPTPRKYVGQIVNQLRFAIVIDAGLLAFSMAAVMLAFAAAGFEALHQSQSCTYLVIMRSTTEVGGLLCLIAWIAFMLQLYRCKPSKNMLLALVLPALPWPHRWPASIQKMHARIGHSTRFGYPVIEPKDFMKKDLVAHYASKQRSLGTGHAPCASGLISIHAMKQQVKNLDIPDLYRFIQKVYTLKQDENFR